MPPYKPVSSLSQLCVDTLTRLIYRAVDPANLHDAIINFYKKSLQQNRPTNKSVTAESQIKQDMSGCSLDSYAVDVEVNRKSHDKTENGLENLIPCDDDIIPDCPASDLENAHLITSSVPRSKGHLGDTENPDHYTAELLQEHDASTMQWDEIDSESVVSPEQYQYQIDVVYNFVKCLINSLTSHSHCGLHNQLFWSILPKLNYLYTKHSNQQMRELIRSVVPSFISSSMREFSFGSFKMFTEASMFQVLYRRLKVATNLEKLVFGRSCYWRSKSIKYLGTILQEMKNLQYLHIHYICQPEMLRNLSRNCTQLRELSLKGSKDITDSEIPLLSDFKNLDTIDISGTSVTGKGCRILIKSLPSLIWLTHCPFNCNSDTLIFESRAELFNYIKNQLKRQHPLRQYDVLRTSNESISGWETTAQSNSSTEFAERSNSNDTAVPSSSEKDFESRTVSLNLKSFWLFNTTTEELLLTLLCPQLEHLRLDFVLQDLEEEPDTNAIRRLPHLSALFLYMYDRCPIQLVTSIVESGTCLTNLHLHLGDEWFFVAPILNTVAQCCPNLISLTMEGDYKGQHPLEESDSRLDFTVPPEGLPHLREARISGCVSDLRLLHLLTQAPNLHLLYLDGELEWLRDDTFTDAIRMRLLLQLKELWFNVSTSVTLMSVRRLLQSENNLQRVGRLCLMASASKEVYQDLLYFVKRTNLSTVLIWVTDQREMQVKPGTDL